MYNLGQPDAHIYLVESGQVKTLTHTRDGKQCLLSIHGPADVFGESSVLAAKHTETAQAMQVTTLVQVHVAQILNDCDPPLREALIGHMANRLLEQQQVIANLVTMDSEHRLGGTAGKTRGKGRKTQGPDRSDTRSNNAGRAGRNGRDNTFPRRLLPQEILGGRRGSPHRAKHICVST
ncbi:hypothetical protein SVIOM342S_01118 [Streptomyces violaceorubidus]